MQGRGRNQMTTKTVRKEVSFEAAVEELEGIVRKMEAGGLSLEESLEAYTRGTELAKFCRAKLDDAQLRIQKLESDGRLAAFDPEGAVQ